MSSDDVNYTGYSVVGANGCKITMGRRLGKGHFAYVYKAVRKHPAREGTEETLVDEVAVKVVNLKKLSRKDKEHQAAELKIMRQMDHPHILPILDVFESPEYLFIVLPLMRGGDLFGKVSGCGKFSERDASTIIRKLCSAIEYLHARQVSHRDLKPENILCGDGALQEMDIKLADFGFARMFDIDMSTSCGTVNYAPPEIFRGNKYNEKCDMWGVGAITYVLLTGCFPFYGSTDKQTAQLIVRGQYNMHNLEKCNISQCACDFLARLLVIDPVTRMSAPQALQHPFLASSEVHSEVDLTLSRGNLSSIIGK